MISAALVAQPSTSGLSAIIRRIKNRPDFISYTNAIVLSIPLYIGTWMIYSERKEMRKAMIADHQQLSDQFTAQIQLLDDQIASAGRRDEQSAQLEH